LADILVAGGAGFIGSNLCARLLKAGETVYCVDNLTTGAERNVRNLQMSRNFRLLQMNVKDVFDFHVDQIYNLASPAAPGHYKARPEETMEANTAGTARLLRLAKDTGAKMVQASTIRVLEDVAPDSPHYCYIEGKRRAEELVQNYHQLYGTDVKIARMFNTYGPGMAKDDSRVVPQFVMRALNGEPLQIVGDGNQQDSFCYVDDMIDGLTAYMASDIKPGPMEFGYPVPIAIIDLARLVRKVVHSDSAIKFNGVARPARELEAKKRRPVPDIREVKERLGWKPRVSLEVGLMMLADYFSARTVS
jgi:UDP-glucuronate decarboxylase